MILVLGLVLTVGAFLGFLLWGRLTNPPPYQVVIENTPPFGTRWDTLPGPGP